MYVIVRDVDDYDYSGPRGNIINMRKRHCRIGKVTLKPAAIWRKHIQEIMRPQPVIPTSYPPAWWQNPVVSGGYVPVTSSGDVPIVPSHGVCM